MLQIDDVTGEDISAYTGNAGWPIQYTAWIKNRWSCFADPWYVTLGSVATTARAQRRRHVA